MEYLSTNEIAKKWGVSRKTVTRYAAEGKIEGAYLVGNTWMIPADAKKESSTVSEAFNVSEIFIDQDDKTDNQYHFPLYPYRNFFEIKGTFEKPEEQKLYAAFESAIDGKYGLAYELSSEAYSLTRDYPIKITCLYVMARCSLYQHKYSIFMKHAFEMDQLFMNDFNHKEEMRTLLIDLETYYKGFDSLLNASFKDIHDYSNELFPIITTMTLYRHILNNFNNKQTIDTSMYEMSLKIFEDKGYIYPAMLLSSELALIHYNQKNYQSSRKYAKLAYELAVQYNGFFFMTELYSVAPRVLDKALKYYKITMDPALKQMTKEFKHSYIGLMLYRSFDATNKKDLVRAFIKSLDQY